MEENFTPFKKIETLKYRAESKEIPTATETNLRIVSTRQQELPTERLSGMTLLHTALRKCGEQLVMQRKRHDFWKAKGVIFRIKRGKLIFRK